MNWMDWIRPHPNSDEIEIVQAKFFNHIDRFKIVALPPEVDWNKSLPVLKNALDAIRSLPDPLRYREDALSLADEIELRILLTKESIESRPRGPGRKHEILKKRCLILTCRMLSQMGKRVTGGESGTLPNLALFVWREAGFDPNRTDSPKAWAQAWMRIRKEQRRIYDQIITDNEREHKQD